MEAAIAVVGLGYVGLPVAVALAERCGALTPRVVGFDIAAGRVAELQAGHKKMLEKKN